MPHWNKNVPVGTVSEPVNLSLVETITVRPSVDSESGGLFYDGPSQVPATINSNDNPAASTSSVFLDDLKDANGNKIGTVKWSLAGITIAAAFFDWCALIDPIDGMSYPAVAGWTVNIDFNNLPAGIQSSVGLGFPITQVTPKTNTNALLETALGIASPVGSDAKTTFTK